MHSARTRLPCQHCDRTGICTSGETPGTSCRVCVLDAQRGGFVSGILRLLGLARSDPRDPNAESVASPVQCSHCRGMCSV